MTNQPSFGQPTKLLVVDILKRKLLEEEAIFFEMDILVHMMRAMSIEKIKDFFMEVSVASVEQNNRIGKTFSMNCLIKIIFPKEIVDQIKLAEESKNIQKKIDTYDYLIQTYAIMTTDVAFFNTIWRGNNTVTCRYIIEMKSGETMKIGPFKHIDLVRDFK